MRTSPRKKLAQPVGAPKSQRQPARCRKCPDRPLKSECEHGRKKTKEALSQQSEMDVDVDIPPTPTADTAPQAVALPDAAPPAAALPGAASSPPLHATMGSPVVPGAGNYAQHPQFDPLAAPIAPGGFHASFQGGRYTFHPMYHPTFGPYTNHGLIPTGQHFIPPQPSPLPLDPTLAAVAPSGSSNPGSGTPAPVAPNPVVEPPPLPVAPNLIADTPAPATPLQEVSTASPMTASNPSPDEDIISDDESEGEEIVTKPSAKPTKKNARTYASNRNPVHGFIDGVGRGNRVLKMARRRALKTVFTDQSQASSNWRRLVRDFITRAEDISNRTASWLYVAAHNPSAGQPFTHFASRRLRMEAPEDIQKIHQHVASMMTVLKRADRANSIQHEKDKEQSLLKIKQIEDQLTAANEVARKAEAEAQALREEAAARDRLLRQYGWSPGNVPTQAAT
ncbi:hypothetical protein EST38_g13652 [Candolleomyces aberdarensis]|uniref:Uncharacterized protein n=1 Tax=Candolleomyces aberdarensis TaxID=2316362 RepID=A0A4Q2D1N9_9AGAR|nr:hypothetical protein EST38_g13652 [Candolleomyces aberdarensis]